jgi:hypothetical protein
LSVFLNSYECCLCRHILHDFAYHPLRSRPAQPQQPSSDCRSLSLTRRTQARISATGKCSFSPLSSIANSLHLASYQHALDKRLSSTYRALWHELSKDCSFTKEKKMLRSKRQVQDEDTLDALKDIESTHIQVPELPPSHVKK